MAAATTHRLRSGIVLVTLALCAFFTAQGATALLSARVLEADPQALKRPLKRSAMPSTSWKRHDPSVVLRRNMFNSSLGDLSEGPLPDPQLPAASMPAEQIEEPCKNKMRLIGTVVVPGQLEQSLAAIVGDDAKAGLHRGGAEVDGSRIRSIQSDTVILQTSSGFCRLAMFEVESSPKAKAAPVAKRRTKKSSKKKSKRGPDADRNAGLSDEELAQGIEKINETNYNLSRSMLNKILDNAGRLIGIAAVSPKVEGGSSVGMEIRGIRANTLLTKLGIQNGDVLESVNGQSLTSTDAAIGAYTTLRTSDKFNLSIRREGKSMIINYNLQ
jgi:general secretion pathway protein C